MTTPVDMFQGGNLTEAVDAATAAVKARPTDVPARSLLCELLCFSGDLVRADKQLDAVVQIDANAMPGVSLMRHLIRSELSRQEVFESGRIPDFLDQPSDSQQKRLQALIAIREGKSGEAAALLAAADETDPVLTGTSNGTAFEGFRDLDDLLGPTFEVFTATGKYYWLSCDQVVSLEFEPVTHLTDMLWRAASIETSGSVSGRVHLPVLYHGSSRSENMQIRIGRNTDWLQATDDAPILGCGQREFLVGDDAVPIMELCHLQFAAAPTP